MQSLILETHALNLSLIYIVLQITYLEIYKRRNGLQRWGSWWDRQFCVARSGCHTTCRPSHTPPSGAFCSVSDTRTVLHCWPRGTPCPCRSTARGMDLHNNNTNYSVTLFKHNAFPLSLSLYDFKYYVFEELWLKGLFRTSDDILFPPLPYYQLSKETPYCLYWYIKVPHWNYKG